jgi:Ca-activated chloride channel family protein
MPSVSISRERRLSRAAAVVLMTPLAAAAALAQTHTPETFRSATELVVLQVAVTDTQRRLVSDLQQEDFGVFEEGVQQRVALFASAEAPLDLMLLLDASASMHERMPATRQAAIGFVRTLKPADRASVLLFSDTVRVAQTLTGDRKALETAIEQATTSGGTALHEALYIALRDLARARRGADGSLRRQALVVLTDGDDTRSSLTFGDVLDEARRSAVTIFTIVPSAPAWEQLLDPAPRRRPAAPYDMRQLAEETGGRAFAPAQIQELAGVYADIAEELSRQYWLGYVPSTPRSGFRRVSVRVLSQPTLRARTRNGYYGSMRPGAAAAVPAGRRSVP